MNSSNTNLASKASNQAPAVFFCPNEPIFTWILSDRSTFRAAIIISCIACPITVLLNILVIVLVSKKRQLQKNSNILLASLALADCLVGSVSMPLSISLDALLLQKAVGYFICRIAFANQLVLYAAVCSSLYHLTVIAWERYVAIRKWNRYKVIVTRKRVKNCAGIAWLLAVLTTTPARLLTALGVDYNFIKILDLILTLPSVICIVLIGFFYIMVYLGVRKQRARDDSDVNVRATAKMEGSIARTTGILSVSLLIFYIPSIVVPIFGESVPFLRTSSFFRWSELLTQLNSLVNPLLYCFVLNRHFRREILKMLSTNKPKRIQPLTGVQQRSARRINASSEDSQELKAGQREDIVEMPGSFRDAGFSKPRQSGDEESSSSSCVENLNRHTICVDVHQPKSIKWSPNNPASSNAVKRAGEKENISVQSRCPESHVHHHDCNEIATSLPGSLFSRSAGRGERDPGNEVGEIDVIDMEFATEQQNFKGKTKQRPKTSVLSQNSRQPEAIRRKPVVEVTNGLKKRKSLTKGTRDASQRSMHYVCQESCNEIDVIELVKGQAKTTQRSKMTASSPKGNASPGKTDLELSGTAAKL
ncbi:uncharacterized protein LOC144632963 [Oculina patagonica]